jgi:hypothetical protein
LSEIKLWKLIRKYSMADGYDKQYADDKYWRGTKISMMQVNRIRRLCRGMPVKTPETKGGASDMITDLEVLE